MERRFRPNELFLRSINWLRHELLCGAWGKRDRFSIARIVPSAAFVSLPPAGPFLCRQRNGQKKPPKGKRRLIFSKVKGSGQATVTIEDIRNFEIPVPPQNVQHSIVSILDKFTALIENIETELSLRQKQYEYYREELLRFERTTF